MRDILIVEDGLHERERLQRLFTTARFSVSCAESVHEAEKLLELNQFRMAIIDIGLGDKSGSYLFEQLRRSAKVQFVIILTGNPSIHLKQRFLDQGAVAHIVKASPGAANEALLDTIRSFLGTSEAGVAEGIPLRDFLREYLGESSRELFLDENHEVPRCSHCGSTSYLVTFNHRSQIPPIIEGRVICRDCSHEMDPEVG
jgi:DNA-binding response OmpR family regulator